MLSWDEQPGSGGFALTRIPRVELDLSASRFVRQLLSADEPSASQAEDPLASLK
jgi:hypothetical protein